MTNPAHAIPEECDENLQSRVLELEQQLQRTRTELKAAQQELDDLAHFIAHDLRAPLRGMDGYSQALLQDYEACLDEVGKAYLNFIRDSGRGASILIDRLLLYMRALRGPLLLQTVDLSSLVQASAERLQAEHPQRQVELQITPGLAVYADPRMLKVVIDELMDNAWKFSRHQPAAQIVFCSHLEDDQPVFVLQDNGAGFNMQYVPRLFRPFERLHGAHEFDGTGLGLAICRRIIERHAGRIWASGAPGQGARLFFTLPPGGLQTSLNLSIE